MNFKKVNFTIIGGMIISLVFLPSFLKAQNNHCVGPFGGAGDIGDPAYWTYIDDVGNPSDGGYGAVNYNYSYFDRFVRIGDYLEFLNDVDPSNTGNYEGELVNMGFIEYTGGQWQARTWNICQPHNGQLLSAAEVEKIAVSYISFNQAARMANWMDDGDVNTGAYTFASNDGNAGVTNINLNCNCIRLPTEDEFYKAAYYDPGSGGYNLYGTTVLDGGGEPLRSTVTSNGIYNTPNGHAYDLSVPLFVIPGISSGGHCLWQIQSGQGGQSEYGLYNMVGGFHHYLTDGAISGKMVLRPQNQLQGGAPEQSKNWRDDSLDPSVFYASPSFHLVIVGDECGGECTVNITTNPGSCDPNTNTYTLTGAVTWDNGPSRGTVTVNVDGQSDSFTADVSRSGNYSISGLTADGASHTVMVSFSEDSGCNTSTTYTAPTSCTASCGSSVTASAGACDPNTNSYTVTGTVTWTNSPGTGTATVTIDGQTDLINISSTDGSANFSIAGLTADGASHTVSVVFSDDNNCNGTTTYTAPANCSPSCSATEVHANPICNDNGTQDPDDDYFTIEITGTINNGSGQYLVRVNSFVTSTIASGSPVNIIGDGQGGNPLLEADGTTIYTFRVEDANDNTCFTEFTLGAVDHCSSCTPEEYTICDDDSNSAMLTGEPGYSNYVWFEYDINTMMKGVQVGTGQSITIMGSDVGPAGSQKYYIYEATDISNCTDALCCPISIQTEECCPNPNCAGVRTEIRSNN